MARRSVFFLSAALMMACTNTVFDEATGGGGSGASGGNDESQGGDGASVPSDGGAGGCGIGCGPFTAIIYEEGSSGSTTTSGSSGSGQSVTVTTGGPSYEMVHLQISDAAGYCAIATEPLPCGGYTRYTLTLPKNMLTPGIVYVSHPDVWLSIEETLDADPNGDCGYGFGGGFEDGQLEIFSVDQHTLVGALVGIEVFGSFDPNGEVIAGLCF